MRTLYYLLVLGAAALFASACAQAEENQTGSEYMPDMAHSIAYEANTYFEYYLNTWDSASVKGKYELVQPGTPVKGTVPRGYAGYYLADVANAKAGGYSGKADAMARHYGVTDAIQTKAVPVNGSVPYYYEDTDQDRLRAVADMKQNPFPITVDGLERGKELYDLFCTVCHGVKGDGNGWIYENGAYPAAPRNFLVQAWVDTSAGLYYHAMMHGKNVMGAYKDKVSYEERWQIIHHIRALQAKEFKKSYSAEVNDLLPNEAMTATENPLYARAFSESFTRAESSPAAMSHGASHNSDTHQGDEHSDDARSHTDGSELHEGSAEPHDGHDESHE